MIKNRIMIPQITANVISALNARGKNHFFIWIRQNRSTRGRPIIEKTPDTRIYTTILLKNHAHPSRTSTPQNIRMVLNVAFIVKDVSYCKPNPNFWNSLKIVCRHLC